MKKFSLVILSSGLHWILHMYKRGDIELCPNVILIPLFLITLGNVALLFIENLKININAINIFTAFMLAIGYLVGFVITDNLITSLFSSINELTLIYVSLCSPTYKRKIY